MKTNQFVRFVACSMLTLSFFGACKEADIKQSVEETIASDKNNGKTAATTTFTFKRGINLSTWLSHMSSSHGKTTGAAVRAAKYVTKAHIDQLKADGFDHIRLPIDESLFYSNSSTRTKDTSTVNLIKECISWCKSNNMKVILNFHIPGDRQGGAFKKADYWTAANSTRLQNHAVELWKDWSATFSSYSVNDVAYELFNEPNAPETNNDATWNTFQNRMIAAVRALELNRVLFVGPNRDNSVERLQYLNLPANDPNLIVTFHFYQPTILTHYPVSYTNSNQVKVTPRIKLKYPGQIFGDTQWANQEDKDALNKFSGNFNDSTQINRLKPVVTFANRTGLRVHCGEFGCNDEYEKQTSPQGTAELKYRLFKDYVTVFFNMKNHADPTKKVFIPFTVWGYKGSFGIYKTNTDGTTALKYPQQTFNGTYYNSIKYYLTGMYPTF